MGGPLNKLTYTWNTGTRVLTSTQKNHSSPVKREKHHETANQTTKCDWFMSLWTCMLRKSVFKTLSHRCTQTHAHRHTHTHTHTHAHKTPSWVSLIFTSRPHASCAATGPKITLRFLRLLVYMCVRTYHVCNNYVTYIVAMRPCFSGLRQFRRLLCVAIMSSLAQLWVWDGYREAEAT